MIKITQEMNKFKISYGQRVKNYAKNKIEVVNAVKHYFAMKHNSKQCPSCKEEYNETEK